MRCCSWSGPVYVSGFVNLLRDVVPEPAVVPKEAISLTLAFCVLWPSGWLAERRRFRGVMGVMAVGILVHALVGLYQLYAFSHDEFPLLAVFQNPSFKSMESWAVEYARYIKRPCGLFPEPSAMAASLGPFVVVLAGLLLDPGAVSRFGLGRRARGLFAAALAAGFAAAGAVAVGADRRRSWRRCWPSASATRGPGSVRRGRGGPWSSPRRWWRRPGHRPTWRSGRARASTERIESSWGLRATSIVTGLTANTEPFDLAFGVGPGQSTPVVRRLMAGVPKAETQDDMAVWSLTACYYMEEGLVGGVGMLAAGRDGRSRGRAVVGRRARARGFARSGSSGSRSRRAITTFRPSGCSSASCCTGTGSSSSARGPGWRRHEKN